VVGEDLGDEDVRDVLLALEDHERASGSAAVTVSMSAAAGSGLSERVSMRVGTVIFAACSDRRVPRLRRGSRG
jgi:hypothetical protein